MVDTVIIALVTKAGRATRCRWSTGFSNTTKNTTKMIELYLSKVTENSELETAGKYYARVDYKQTMGVQDMAHHMAEHNTMFSEGSITGILIDFVKCVREMVLMGNTVKIDNLAIFKASVEANGLEVLYDAQQDKVAQATMGTLAEGQKTGPAVKVVKLLAQSTGIVGNVEERILNGKRSLLIAIDLSGGAVDGLLLRGIEGDEASGQILGSIDDGIYLV